MPKPYQSHYQPQLSIQAHILADTACVWLYIHIKDTFWVWASKSHLSPLRKREIRHQLQKIHRVYNAATGNLHLGELSLLSILQVPPQISLVKDIYKSQIQCFYDGSVALLLDGTPECNCSAGNLRHFWISEDSRRFAAPTLENTASVRPTLQLHLQTLPPGIRSREIFSSSIADKFRT